MKNAPLRLCQNTNYIYRSPNIIEWRIPSFRMKLSTFPLESHKHKSRSDLKYKQPSKLVSFCRIARRDAGVCSNEAIGDARHVRGASARERSRAAVLPIVLLSSSELTNKPNWTTGLLFLPSFFVIFHSKLNSASNAG